jgi:hypothetical protein
MAAGLATTPNSLALDAMLSAFPDYVSLDTFLELTLAVPMELAGLLERLGRDMDLLALLSARMDEGDLEAQREVAPLRRAVLLRLAREARAAGRDSEGELYEMMAAPEE